MIPATWTAREQEQAVLAALARAKSEVSAHVRGALSSGQVIFVVDLAAPILNEGTLGELAKLGTGTEPVVMLVPPDVVTPMLDQWGEHAAELIAMLESRPARRRIRVVVCAGWGIGVREFEAVQLNAKGGDA